MRNALSWRALGGFVAALAVSGTLAACGGDDDPKPADATTADTATTTAAAPTGTPIEFGALGQLSGPFVYPETKQVLEALAKEVNDAGGVRGRPVQFNACDGSFADPANQPNCVRKIVSSKALAFVGGLYELGTAAPAEKAGMAILTSASTAPETETASTAFMMQCTQTCDTRAMADVLPTLDVKKLGIIYSPQPGLTQQVKLYNELLEPKGIGVEDLSVPATTTDFVSVLSKAKSAGVDFILTFSGAQQIPLIVSAAQRIAYKPKFGGNVGICDSKVAAELKSSELVCTLYAKPWNDASWEPLNTAMDAAGHGDYTRNFAAYQAWFNGRMAVAALKNIPEDQEITRESFLNALKQTSYTDPMMASPEVDFANLPGPCEGLPRVANGWVNVIRITNGEPELAGSEDTCKAE